MKRKIFMIFYCGLLTLLTSCNNYLDVKPKGKIIPKTAEDFSTIIHYWLDQIEKGTDDVIVPSPVQTDNLEMFADDLDASLANSYTYTDLYVGIAINKNQGHYKTLYSVIKDCNMIIGNMEDTESEIAKTLLGTAWSIRSICYYNLMQRYCEPYQPETSEETLGLPLVNEFDMEAKPARSNLKETAEFILNGFKKALSYNVTNNDFLFTQSVTKAYMARFLFWTQDWNNAILYAKEILEKYPMLEAEEYAESINQKLQKTHNVIIRSYTNDNEIGTLDYAGAQVDVKKRPLCKNLVDLFTSTPNDIRKTNTYNSKRITNKIVTTKFRSEELCLIIAESYAHLKDETNALLYLNMLRSKRITLNYTTYTMDNLPEVFEQNITSDATGIPLSKLMSVILCERRKELFLEGDRWFELKRNGRPEFWVAANGKKYVTEKYLYTYPIPKADIKLFPGLLVQNPGYIE
ncbi:RagB/SusD family nutrient uptake outer membrane protein [Bacteroides sp.]|uniref:RagB/SusD family nutrient uptake outer membrane protein n=1 Tax=Bacteroides sp. TaxID=29523 RepID=UPI00261690C4|nr:RagB/SusD family nutrient uptake outer membrane protein [Bacteroides sp.]MDD3036514.1 RagB/SusD family nutrient uptake outer membrane protein [Bacteroides sp.]